MASCRSSDDDAHRQQRSRRHDLILTSLRKNWPGTTAGVLTDQALKDWAASRSVQVPLLGIRTSVDDAPVLGTATLLVLAFWLVLLTRRENHTVGLLLRDTDTELPEDDESESPGHRPSYSSGQRWLIFHTVASNSVFITCDRSLAPVQSLGPKCSASTSANGGFKAWMSERAYAFLSRFFFDFGVSSIVFGSIAGPTSNRMRSPLAHRHRALAVRSSGSRWWCSSSAGFRS